MNYEIEQELANKILNYLATKPYIEVYMLIKGLESLKEIKDV